MEDFEDSAFVASEHDQLVSAISKLDKTQHIIEPTRNEPTNLNSEFNLIKRTNKLNLKSVAKILENTAHHVQISKKLKKTHDKSNVLSKPLEKPQAERIKRATVYDETKKKVGRWDPVVARSRTVDYVSFPLKHVSTKLQPTREFLSKLKLKSELEKELEAIDPPDVVQDDEEEQELPMSYEDMVLYRQHLAKLRAQESYKAAKAKRQGKIKSKKYHRVLKKEKMKQQLKEFEELQKNDPEEALKKLDTIEKSRALERHTLRHKNTGKWAKNKLIRAKYDKEVRQELAEQLAISRSLTQKVENDQSSDNESSDDETYKVSQELAAQLAVSTKLTPKVKNVQSSDDDSTEDEVSNSKIEKCEVEKNKSMDIDATQSTKNKTAVITESRGETVNKVNVRPISTSNWMVESVNDNKRISAEQISTAFEDHQTNIEKQVEKKLKEMRWNIEKLEQAARIAIKNGQQKPKARKEKDNLEYLGFKTLNKASAIDHKLIETSSKTVEDDDNNKTPLSEILNSSQLPATEAANSKIDLVEFVAAKPKYLNTDLSQAQNEYDELDDEQVVPRVNIVETHEDGDVVASFRQEKEDEINKDKPQNDNLTLPGWGSWGGKGIKPQKRKRNRFIQKPPPKMPRRDENKGDIIIREYNDPKLAIHKVKDVPFPFESVKDYEASIRAPLGNTFITENAHRKLTRPSVITKAGTIIEPMDEDELLVSRNRNFRDKSVLKILGQK